MAEPKAPPRKRGWSKTRWAVVLCASIALGLAIGMVLTG